MSEHEIEVREYISNNYPDYTKSIKDICENGDVHLCDGFTIIKTGIRYV